MTVSKIIGNQTGVQYQGVQDYSEADTSPALVNALFTGSFRHGDFNKPFKVTKTDYRAKLGYDPENLDFIAVEDALNSGASYIWVMRVDKKKNNGGTEISCVGATFMVSLGTIDGLTQSEKYQLKINGALIHIGVISDGDVFDDVRISYVGNSIWFYNRSMTFKRIEILSLEKDNLKYLFKPNPQESGNETILLEDGKNDFYSKAYFCLSNNVE